jgi:hypothetical protein
MGNASQGQAARLGSRSWQMQRLVQQDAAAAVVSRHGAAAWWGTHTQQEKYFGQGGCFFVEDVLEGWWDNVQ